MPSPRDTPDAGHHNADKAAVAAFLIGLYCVAHAGLRFLTSANLGENDPQIALSIQDGFRWSYGIGEPPLIEWIILVLSQILGPTNGAFLAMRYGLLALALLVVFAIARRITRSNIWALIAVESYALVYQISWRLHEGFTHPMAAMVGALALVYALIRLREGATIGNAGLLFGSLLVGFLSSSWFYGFFTALFIAALFDQGLRQRAVHPLSVIAVSAATGLAVPYWINDPAFWSGAGWQAVLVPQGALGVALSDRLDGLLDGLAKPLLFLSPLLPIVVIWFWPSLGKMRPFRVHLGEPNIAFLWHSMAWAALGLVILGLGFGYAGYPEHALMPLFVTGPIVLVRLIQISAPSVRRLNHFLLLCLGLMVVAFGARAANLIVLDPVCNRCYFGLPFKGLANELQAHYPDHIIIADNRRLGGNLRAFLPSRQSVWALNWPRADAPVEGPAVLIVDRRERIERRLDQASAFGFVASPSAGADVALTIPWRHLFRQDGYRSTTWYALEGYANPGQAAQSP